MIPDLMYSNIHTRHEEKSFLPAKGWSVRLRP